jgi:hypothetical protein
MKRFWVFGIGTACILGWALQHVMTTGLAIVLAALITFVAGRLYARHWTKKFKPSRAWARALYAQGMISMEELNQFYAEHEDPDDEVSHTKPTEN